MSRSVKVASVQGVEMKHRVLVIDDDPAFGKTLTYLLRANGYDVSAVESGAEGLVEFHRNAARIVLIDLVMPGLSGVEVIRQIRAMNSRVVIIAMSGAIPLETRGAGRPAAQAGADICLSKPFDAQELISLLESFLRSPD